MEGMLSSLDVANRLGRSVQTIQKWARAGKIPFRKYNGRLYFPKEEIEAFIRSMPGAVLSTGTGGAGDEESGGAGSGAAE